MALKTRVGRIPATEPNWSSPVTASYQFQTGIVESEEGYEQRWALRERPRLQLSFTSLLREEAYWRHQADLTGVGLDQTFVLPCPWRLDELAAQALSGQPVVSVDPMPFWAVADARVVLESATVQEAATILSVAGTNITLTSNLQTTFAAGSRIRPAYLARFQPSAEFEARISSVREMGVVYDVEPGDDPVAAASITPDTFEGRDVFLTKPNWSRDVTMTFESARRVLDPGRGRIDVRNARGFPTLIQKMQYSQTTSARAEELLAFFLRQKGRRGSFFMPTWQVDMRPEIAAAAGSSTLRISGTDFRDVYVDSPLWNTLYVNFGTAYQINRIASMATSSGDTILTMVDTWDQQVPAGHPVSWCPRWRFASDQLKLDWQTNAVAEVAVSVQQLRNEAA